MGKIEHPSDLTTKFHGSVEFVTAPTGVTRAALSQDTLAEYPVPWTQWRVWDAAHTNLPGTSAADDLALVGGTFGTNVFAIETYDVKAAGAVTLYARAQIRVPIEYVAGQTIQLRVSGGMETTVADTTATVDVEAYLSNRDGDKTGSDLCSTAAQSINSLIYADKDFTLAAASLNPGDEMDVRLTVAVNDAATGTTVKARIGAVELLCDVKG